METVTAFVSREADACWRVFTDIAQLTSWVLEWGQRARVVEPPELVERVRAELEGALKGYAKKK